MKMLQAAAFIMLGTTGVFGCGVPEIEPTETEAVTAAAADLVVGVVPPALANGIPVPYSCGKGVFGEDHGGYLWFFKYKSTRFDSGTYYNNYDAGLFSYPRTPVVYVGTVERSCGHSGYIQ